MKNPKSMSEAFDNLNKAGDLKVAVEGVVKGTYLFNKIIKIIKRKYNANKKHSNSRF